MTPEFVKANKILLKRSLNEWLDSAQEDAATGNTIFGGGTVRQLEEDFTRTFNARYAVALSSGTAAIHTALESCGLKKGSRVFIINSKWQGLDKLVKYCSMKAVEYNIDDETEEKIRIPFENCKAIVLVRKYGDNKLIKKISRICSNYGIILIEDWAALSEPDAGRRYAPEYGDFATFSFGYNKWIQAGEGGILLCNDESHYKKAVKLTQHPVYLKSRVIMEKNIPALNYRIHPLAAFIAKEILHTKCYNNGSCKIKSE